MTSARPIVVVLAADSNFAKQLGAAIASIETSATRAHELFVLHDGFDPAVIEQISGIAGEAVTVRWLDARSSTLDRALLPNNLPTASLFRLRIADLLPHEIERVIYLDADVIVRRPLDDVWESDLDGRVLGAVRDPVVPWAAAPAGLPWVELGLDPDTAYCNVGVLVIDVNRWRSQQISEHALDLLARHRFRYADQCGINAVVAGAWTRLGPRWNLQAGHLASGGSLAWITESPETLTAAIADPAVVHFNTSALRRPWQQHCTHPWRDLWFEYLDLTPWEGWRPPVPVEPRGARKLARRMRKAASIMLRG